VHLHSFVVAVSVLSTRQGVAVSDTARDLPSNSFELFGWQFDPLPLWEFVTLLRTSLAYTRYVVSGYALQHLNIFHEGAGVFSLYTKDFRL
jgi:hypothetical protein